MGASALGSARSAWTEYLESTGVKPEGGASDGRRGIQPLSLLRGRAAP
jgi:hypothetical protein